MIPYAILILPWTSRECPQVDFRIKIPFMVNFASQVAKVGVEFAMCLRQTSPNPSGSLAMVYHTAVGESCRNSVLNFTEIHNSVQVYPNMSHLSMDMMSSNV